MKKQRADGTTYYYYYKKKIGRKKKVGRKKKPKKRGRSWQERWNFKIIKCTFKKQDEFIGKYHDAEEVENIKRIIEQENKQIVFPTEYVNSSRFVHDAYNQTQYVSEYLILKRIETDIDKTPTKLRDEYGRLIPHTTNSNKWAIYDKIPCLKEETFWVYGFNPLSDRKTYREIYDYFYIDRVEDFIKPVLQTYIYKNKVIFVYDSNSIGFVICKNQSDAIRLYNKLSGEVYKNKLKNIYFMGAFTSYDEIGKSILNKMQDLTGWTLKKLRQKAT